MIKVVHILNKLNYGGAERLLLDVCRKVDKDDFDLSVVVLKTNNELADQFADFGIKVKVFDKKGKFDLDVIERVTDYLKNLKPDIVHTHLFAGDFWGAMAARQAGVKIIISTKHDTLKESRLRDYLAKQSRKKMTKVVAISDAIRDYLIKDQKLPLDKIEVIHNGIDVGKFYNPDKRILQNRTFVIGSVGRLSKEKGHKHLIRACRFLKTKNWKLILVGDGPMKKELQELSRSLGIDDKVEFTGGVSDVRPYLEQIDAFVLPSISEGLSLAVLEAAAAGNFIIATNVGGVPEIIKDRETGLLIKPKSIEQLVDRLNWVLENVETSQKMALKLQDNVVRNFDINNTIKEYEHLYKRLVL